MPHNPVPRRKRDFAKAMRHEPTEAEERLWEELRGRRLAGIKFRRQVPAQKKRPGSRGERTGAVERVERGATLDPLGSDPSHQH